LSVSQEELMFLQSQLEGLESIFLELMPFGVELKRQQVQDYYDKRFDQATKPVASVAETELRRQFNTKANQVRNLVDSAESLGDAGNKLNLIRAAATLPDERSKAISQDILNLCHKLLYESAADADVLETVLNDDTLGPVEARLLLGSMMFLIVEDIDINGMNVPLRDLLNRTLMRVSKLLARNDPFLVEAQCAHEALKDEQAS
jgi:hypothetical protein